MDNNTFNYLTELYAQQTPKKLKVVSINVAAGVQTGAWLLQVPG